MKLVEFDSALSKANSSKALQQLLVKWLLSVGVKTFSFTYYVYHPKSKDCIKYDFASADFKRWHKHFIEQNYDYVDTTMDQVYQSNIPVFWDIREQMKNAKSEREYKMREDSLNFGVKEGICIPIHGPNQEFANLLLVQMQGQHFLKDWHTDQYELVAVTQFFYQYLRRFLMKELNLISSPELSQRESQCLVLLAQHFSLTEIAKTLLITERTVNFHIQHINRKLGVKNKYQAVAKAIKLGLL